MDVRRASATAGLASPAVAFAGILGAALTMPGFDPTRNALSDLGVAGPVPALLFNGGLILAGLLALAFVPALWDGASTRLHRVGAAVFGVDAVFLGLIGVFPSGTPQHTPVALAFYLLLTAALWGYAAADWLAGRRPSALAALGLGALNLAAWVGWALTGPVFRPGLALPEIPGALALGVWTGWRARGLLGGRDSGPSA